ncbi:MAG: alpha/beta fold hydrolase [Oleiphilaceae bacterium]|nr:alpha/beta fold hydrolase [Oleiphilaceae bacterium]
MTLKSPLTAARPLLVLLLTTLVLSACSKEGLYQMAMDREKSQAGLESREMTINGMDIAYLESERREGQDSLVLVHGFGANNLNWLRMARHLKDHYHIIAPDLPGHGQSTQDPELNYSIDSQVDNLAALLDQLDVDSAHLAGNSMGGAIVAMFGAAHPERTRSLALLNPAGIQEHPSELDQRLEDGENPLVVNDPDDYSQLLDFVMEERPFIPWPISSVMAEKAAANQDINRKIFQDIRGGSSEDFREHLTRIQAPTLILWGARDRVLNAANAEVFDSLIPDSRVVIFDDIGHVPMIEAPERTAKAIHSITGQ